MDYIDVPRTLFLEETQKMVVEAVKRAVEGFIRDMTVVMLDKE